MTQINKQGTLDPGRESLLQARALLVASMQAHGALPSVSGPGDRIVISYAGTIDNKGHYSKPGETKTFAISGSYEFRPTQRAALHEGNLVEAKGEKAQSSTVKVVGERGLERDFGDEKGAETNAEGTKRLRADLFWVLPQGILQTALERPESLRWLGIASLRSQPHALLCFTDERGQSWNLYLDQKTHLVTRVERFVAHPVEGDTSEWIEVDGYQNVEGYQLPTHRREQHLEAWSTWKRELRMESIVVDRVGTRAAIEIGPSSQAPLSPGFEVSRVDTDVYVAKLVEEDCKVLFVVLADGVVVLEAPLSSRTGEKILAAIRTVAPSKPIRYVMMSHYHPHYMNGLRPFVAAGATLVTTPGNRAHVEAIVHRSQRFEPDALSLSPREPEIQLVSGSKVFGDGVHSIEVYDIGALSEHTEEYLIFYLPAIHLLFEGDLGRFPESGVDVSASTTKRAKRLLNIINKLNLKVDKIVQSWPLQGQKLIATFADLDSLAKAQDAK